MSEPYRLHIFYHIFCNEHTLNIISDQISKIIFSGLYKKINNIYCFLVGAIDHINIIKDYIEKSGNKFKICKIGINDTTFERFTLLSIKQYIEPTDRFLYMHSKGVTKPNNNNVKDWRVLMEYFLIYGHEKCIEKLNEYDTVGINRIPTGHYSGNFWWTTGKYFNTLPKFIPSYYTAPEDYIITKKLNACILYSSGLEGMGHYNSPYSFSNYVDK